ncbi:DUF3306 domain-containing protein [Thalassobaculum sp.]|uniref:DUF3306 domain-containing protein n=1 Tax=Thalassobaculum sp. TaxID=2022740 RepID=UPI0032ED4A58
MSRGPQDGAGFLSRWSRRKQQARDGREEVEERSGDTPSDAAAAAGAAAAEEVDEAALSDSDLLAKYELPDPATLTASDDVAVFMRKGVPARLRNLALRRVWRLDPVLANLDGLNDYDDDYTDAAMLAGVVKTAYQVGRGGAAHLQDAADKLAAERLASGGEPAGPVPEAGEAGDARPDESPAADAPDSGALDSDAPDPDAHGNVIAGPDPDPGDRPVAEPSEPVAGARPEPAEAPRRRRMVFATPDADGLHTGSRHFNK